MVSEKHPIGQNDIPPVASDAISPITGSQGHEEQAFQPDSLHGQRYFAPPPDNSLCGRTKRLAKDLFMACAILVGGAFTAVGYVGFKLAQGLLSIVQTILAGIFSLLQMLFEKLVGVAVIVAMLAGIWWYMVNYQPTMVNNLKVELDSFYYKVQGWLDEDYTVPVRQAAQNTFGAGSDFDQMKRALKSHLHHLQMPGGLLDQMSQGLASISDADMLEEYINKLQNLNSLGSGDLEAMLFDDLYSKDQDVVTQARAALQAMDTPEAKMALEQFEK